ncbi:MAG: helix-turn-helix domain-containing protein [Acidovorax sp.]|nr:helix-turn-helix domain-containing protein [Acidovorax sp.]
MPKQKTSPAEYPQAVLQQIELLGHHIAIARKRRGETQAQWAQRLGVSQPTMARIERGDPSVAMASYVMCMWLVNPAMAVADVIAPQNDHAALEREISKVRSSRPQRQSKSDSGRRALASIREKSTEPLLVRLNAIHAPAESVKGEEFSDSGQHEDTHGLINRVSELGRLSASEEDLSKLRVLGNLPKSLALGRLSTSEEELDKLGLLGKLPKSLALGRLSVSEEELDKLGLLGKLPKSLAGDSVASGLAALILKKRTDSQ